MAEKEERIEISKYDLNNKEWNGDTRIDIQKVYTRKEVIERMAKAMCHSPFESCEGCIVQKKKQACKQALEGMKELAEAALNALLEEHK